MLLKLKVRNTLYAYRDRYAKSVYIPEFNTYVGRVVKPAPKWVSSNEFLLTTGDAESPLRIIHKSDVIEAWVSRKEVDDGVYLVSGESVTYVVTRGTNSYSCTCTAYAYRKQCSHIDSVKKGN